ncbi:hypothetical protein F5B21DRAFT_317854 [Xylaria acuta]|nr:hypothetical protein F5B21DRAFT_317854 [Xylaria acuta]
MLYLFGLFSNFVRLTPRCLSRNSKVSWAVSCQAPTFPVNLVAQHHNRNSILDICPLLQTLLSPPQTPNRSRCLVLLCAWNVDALSWSRRAGGLRWSLALGTDAAMRAVTMPCPYCDGRRRSCSYCRGRGEREQTCNLCHGSGEVTETRICTKVHQRIWLNRC